MNQKSHYSSKEHLLAALNCKAGSKIPCCFMIFTALKEQCNDEFEFVDRQLELGLDARIHLPELPVRFHPDVSIREWKENPADSDVPLLYREYRTPEGILRSIVRQTRDWPYGDHVPLFDDYVTPRSVKYLLTKPADLPAFKFLLQPPVKNDITVYKTEALKVKQFATDRELLFCGGWDSRSIGENQYLIGSDYGTMGVDALMWLCGGTNPLYWAYDQPDFLEELIAILAQWNRNRMEIMLEYGIDLMIKRAWYEGTDFWSPQLYRRFISPLLKKEVELTHQAGAKFGYIITSGMMPLLDEFFSLGIDVLIGIDPKQGKGTDLQDLVDKVGRKICLWGGVNGCITIEEGTPDEVRDEVETAINIFGEIGGFILSPVDNVRINSAHAWRNVLVLIDAWRNYI